jgi:hypothetical protein
MMITYQDILLAQGIAEEMVTPKRGKEYRPQNRFFTVTLRPLLRALMSWLF